MLMENVALNLIKILNDAGFEAYIVGGAVRNKLLNVPVSDYDVTTNALPEQIKNLFINYSLVESGIKHGTVGVIIDKQVYEITTYRKDGEYKGHRRPLNVEFVPCLKEDLKRRDFTVNAMAYGLDGKIIDYFGGIDDLKKGVIRTVGNPDERFTEDALRILRAVRFAAVYGFEIEENTLAAMKRCKSYLKDVSNERIFTELNLTVCGKYCAQAIYSAKEIIFEVIGELKPTDGFCQYSYSHDYDVFNHTLLAMKLCKERTPTVMWALLLHDVGKPFCLTFDEKGRGHTKGHMELSRKIAEPVLNRLKFSNHLKHDVLQIIGDHDLNIGRSKYDVKKYMSKNGLSLTYDLYYHKVADNLAHSSYGTRRFTKEVKQLKYYLDEIVLNGEITNIKDLAISGYDLVCLNLVGAEISKMKEILFNLVLKGHIKNDKDCLIFAAKEFIKTFKI